jgi:hypothetical protein
MAHRAWAVVWAVGDLPSGVGLCNAGAIVRLGSVRNHDRLQLRGTQSSCSGYRARLQRKHHRRCSASIIAAAAQFSASVAELSVVRLYGTKFTIQTYVGFVPMLISIHIMAHAMQAVGWRYAFAILCVGPFLGTVAMLMLRWMPDALRLASGRR